MVSGGSLDKTKFMAAKIYPKRGGPDGERVTNRKIRVAIVDDHPLCRDGLRLALQQDSRFEFTGEAENREAALKLILQQKPDVTVLALDSSGIDGLEITSVLKAKKSATRLVILTATSDEQVFNKALSLGIGGYVMKKNGPEEILNCVAAVAQGKTYVCPTLTDFLLRRRSHVEFVGTRRPGIGALTASERRILKHIAHGKTSKTIAAELSVSRRTVESHRASISYKLQLKGPNSLLQFAVEHRDALDHLT